MKATGGAIGNVLFFRLSDPGQAHPEPPQLPDGLTRSLWAPGWRSLRPAGFTGRTWVVWGLFHRLRVFANQEYAVVIVRDSVGRVVHRTCVFPRYPRFPFMAPQDLQLGDVWTAEEWRGHGLATASLLYVVATKRAAGRHFWYLAERGNNASVRVAERAGFRCAGTGRRVARVGLASLGAFQIEQGSVASVTPPPPLSRGRTLGPQR